MGHEDKLAPPHRAAKAEVAGLVSSNDIMELSNSPLTQSSSGGSLQCAPSQVQPGLPVSKGSCRVLHLRPVPVVMATCGACSAGDERRPR